MNYFTSISYLQAHGRVTAEQEIHFNEVFSYLYKGSLLRAA